MATLTWNWSSIWLFGFAAAITTLVPPPHVKPSIYAVHLLGFACTCTEWWALFLFYSCHATELYSSSCKDTPTFSRCTTNFRTTTWSESATVQGQLVGSLCFFLNLMVIILATFVFRYKLIPLHSSLTSEEQKAVFSCVLPLPLTHKIKPKT